MVCLHRFHSYSDPHPSAGGHPRPEQKTHGDFYSSGRKSQLLSIWTLETLTLPLLTSFSFSSSSSCLKHSVSQLEDWRELRCDQFWGAPPVLVQVTHLRQINNVRLAALGVWNGRTGRRSTSTGTSSHSLNTLWWFLVLEKLQGSDWAQIVQVVWRWPLKRCFSDQALVYTIFLSVWYQTVMKLIRSWRKVVLPKIVERVCIVIVILNWKYISIVSIVTVTIYRKSLHFSLAADCCVTGTDTIL